MSDSKINQSFKTAAEAVQVKIPVGACRFIASVSRTDTEEEAKAFIERISNDFSDATHNAYAYKIGLGDAAITRQSDAAEPAGTAGPPILQAIEHAGLTNVTIVGTRYFGGVKLGIGGLIRAYRACAQAGLEKAGRRTEILYEKMVVNICYDVIGAVLRDISAADGHVDNVKYNTDSVSVIAHIPYGFCLSLQKQIMEDTRGKAEIVLGHTKGSCMQGGGGAEK